MGRVDLEVAVEVVVGAHPVVRHVRAEDDATSERWAASPPTGVPPQRGDEVLVWKKVLVWRKVPQARARQCVAGRLQRLGCLLECLVAYYGSKLVGSVSLL